MTVGEIAEMVRRETGTSSRIVHTDLPSDDPTRRCPDISEARSVLDWEPRVSLEEGLRATIEWFRTRAC